MKRFLIVLAVLMLSIAIRDIQDTVIFHQATMIFQGTFFAYPVVYTLDAWHVSKLIEQFCIISVLVWLLTPKLYSSYSIYTAKEVKKMVLRTWMLRLWYAFVMACAIALTHYVFFHKIYDVNL